MAPVDPTKFGKVAVLMGGWSAEREVSLKSGAAVLAAMQQRGIDAHGIDVQRTTVIQELEQGKFDRAFNILHGPGGEDGVIQGMLEVLGIPYTGSGVMASALAMDKLRTKQLLDGIGLPTPNYMVLDEETDYEYVAANLGLPVMVKPAQQGSSIGMSKVDEVDQLHHAYHAAAEFDGDVIAEQWIHGKEYTVAILGNEALPAILLETPREFYDFEAKYQSNDTQYICPCGLDKEHESQLQRLALSTFQALGAKGWGRVDLFVDNDGHAWVIELNTLPGMTDHSLVPMAAKAKGIEFDELVVSVLSQTLSGVKG
ncbi:MAG: D-alanine--D-alanine ligase [Gammaproteobacteria bacterium]|nr:D-alanine--D-alanine ligase [Gammaproteobacteria bacterium]